MRFEILGPLRGWGDGQEVVLTAGRERTLLAMLLVHANQTLPAEQLIDAIWGPDAPRDARNQLQGCVHRLRRRLRDAGITGQVIQTEPAGYHAAIEPEQLDLLQFRHLVSQARTAAGHGDVERARPACRAALDQWRGRALAGIDSRRIRSVAAALEEERLHALEERIDLDLATGAAGDLVAELTDLAYRHPHRERLHAARMLALYRAGRQADALAAYRHARDLFLDELGTEPGTHLQQLHQAILNHDPILQQPQQPQATPASALPRPRELPADVAGFTGRADALKTLEGLLSSRHESPGAAVISVITGTAGVGKTALAVHWAHRAAKEFPDGQLYLNLRGYAAGAPLRPVEALSTMLRSLGMPSDQVPADEAEASARYRSLLADRRVVVILDNARSVDQVRPLLPGTSTCMALVTSRDRLGGLVARDGAHRIALDVLPPGEAHALLTHLLGTERVAAEPNAVADLARACAYLPLALRIAAATLDEHPTRGIQTLAAALTAGQRLAALEIAGDEETAIRAALDLSYHTIPESAQRLFRLLGLVPGPDFTADAAAALADLPTGEARRPLDLLAGAHLITEHAPGRYTFHDLLREYAEHHVRHLDSDGDRTRARRQLLDWYVRNADLASRMLFPGLARLQSSSATGTVSCPFEDSHQALAWLEAERWNLVLAARYAAEHGPGSIAWLVADALRPYIVNNFHGVEAVALGRAGLAAADAEGDLSGQAVARLTLAGAHEQRDEYDQAAAYCANVPELAARAGWVRGRSAAYNTLGTIRFSMGDLPSAREALEQALTINERIGWRAAQAANLVNLSRVHIQQGQLHTAVTLLTRSLTLNDGRQPDASNRASTLHQLGVAQLLLGRSEEALTLLSECLSIRRDAGNRTQEAHCLRILAACHRSAGRHSQALRDAEAALAILRDDAIPQQEAYGWRTLAEAHHGMGDLHSSISCYRAALTLDRHVEPRAGALIGLAAAQHGSGRPDLAITYALRGLEIVRQLGFGILTGRALTVVAEILLGQGILDQAIRHSTRALTTHRWTGHRLGEARTLAVLGCIRQAAGDTNTARQHWQDARALYDDIGAQPPADLPGPDRGSWGK